MLGGDEVVCETVDVSAGGARLRSDERLPIGFADLVLGGDLVVPVEILEEVLDLDTGLTTARLTFVASPFEGDARSLDVLARPSVVGRPRRHRLVVAGVAAAAVVGVGAVVLSIGGGDDPRLLKTAVSRSAPTSSTVSPSSASPGASEVVVSAPVAPAPSEVAPVVEAVPAPAPATGSPSSGGPAPAAPAPVLATRRESADNRVTVHVGEEEGDVMVASAVGPSEGVDVTKIQLHVIPEPDGSVLPIAVVVTNQDDAALSFPDGVRATVTVSRDGAVVQELRIGDGAELELAPGESVEIPGAVDLDEPGGYEIAATVDVASPVEG